VPDNNTLDQSQSLWIKQIQKIIIPLEVKGKKPNIFFIHPIGGNTYWYKDVCKSLSSGFNGYGIQSIFIDNPENLLPSSIEEMTSLYIEAIHEIQRDGSYIIAGWSFGGKIAYEISKKMIAKGYNVISTIIIDESPNTQYNKINKYIQNYESNNALLKDEKELLTQYNHYKILKKYKINGKINNIILFNSNEIERNANNKNLGWEKHSKKIDRFVIGKDHFDILSTSNSRKIAQILLDLFIKNKEQI